MQDLPQSRLRVADWRCSGLFQSDRQFPDAATDFARVDGGETVLVGRWQEIEPDGIDSSS
jgi:hypothetical protein